LVVAFSDSLLGVRPLVIRHGRAALELDADRQAINAALHDDFPAGEVALHKALGVQGLKNRHSWPKQYSWPGSPGAASRSSALGQERGAELSYERYLFRSISPPYLLG
jgi:hypothetical protein